MKQPPPNPKVSALSKILFRTFLGIFLLSLIVFGIFLKLNRRIEQISGKVVDTCTREAISGRKSVSEKTYLVVEYSVNGKTYTGTTPAPVKNGFSSRPEFVPVYYYSSLPYFAWFEKRSNNSMVYCTIFLLAATGLFVLSWHEMRKEKKALLSAKPRKKN